MPVNYGNGIFISNIEEGCMVSLVISLKTEGSLKIEGLN